MTEVLKDRLESIPSLYDELFNAHGSYMDLEDIARLLRRKPAGFRTTIRNTRRQLSVDDTGDGLIVELARNCTRFGRKHLVRTAIVSEVVETYQEEV